MNFLNPLILFGLFAASIPVLLHLLNLRKLKTVEFSSLKFLKELQKTKIRKLKLKQILLLILRTLIIIFAVLAFARPTIPGSIPYFESYSKTSAIILLDNSFSMDISDEFGNRFNQSKKIVSNIISSLNDGDEIALLPMSDNYSQFGLFTKNIESIQDKINEVKISQIPANLNNNLRKAEALLDDANNLNKEIYIISDAQSNIFNILNDDSVSVKSPVALTVFVPIGLNSKADLQNLSIDSLKVISRIFQKDKLVEVEANIRNGSDNMIKDVVVSMNFNDKSVAQRSSDINSNETKPLTIAAQATNTGQIKASIELESDALDYDNTRYFGFTIPPKPRLLVVIDDENPFVSTSLLTLYDEEHPNNIKYCNSNQLSNENLNNYDAIVLINGNIKQNDYMRVNQYINSGGAVLSFANELSDRAVFSKFLKEIGIGDIKEMKFQQNSPATFANIDSEHPIFDGVFESSGKGNSNIESPKIFSALPAESARTLISMLGGAFLSESKVGEGKILYIAVNADTEWSSFPLTGLFPTLIYRSIMYLTASEDLSIDAKIGEPLIVKIPNKFSSTSTFQIIDPNGNASFVQSVSLPQGNVLSLDNLNIAGIYTILDDNEDYVSQIAVNIDESESQFATIDTKELEQELKKRIPNSEISILEPNQEINTNINRARTGTELWQIFILLAIITAIAEMFVQRVSKNEIGEA